jgi:hypothetical protein
MALSLDNFYEIIKVETGLSVVFDEGQDVETPEMPYISANMLDEKKYKMHQVLSSQLPDAPFTKTYASPSETFFQLGVIYAADQFPEAREMIRKLYMYMLTDKFKLAMKREADDCSVKIVSSIRETKIPKEDIFERRLTFDVVFLWTDYYEEPTGEVIESAEVTGEVVANESEYS